MEDEQIIKLNKIEEKYKIGKIQLSDLVNGAYNLGIEKGESLVQKSSDIHNVIEIVEIPKEQWGVHITHCCKEHGCKYGHPKCPVEEGVVKQKYPCESCDSSL